MFVHMSCMRDGSKQLDTVWKTDGACLEACVLEAPRSRSRSIQPGVRDRSRVLPENYTFEWSDP